MGASSRGREQAAEFGCINVFAAITHCGKHFLRLDILASGVTIFESAVAFLPDRKLVL